LRVFLRHSMLAKDKGELGRTWPAARVACSGPAGTGQGLARSLVAGRAHDGFDQVASGRYAAGPDCSRGLGLMPQSKILS
jgi:hypothetical protein